MGTRKTTISVHTARRWLKANQWRYGQARKGEYIDGHEREDVVEYQNEFVNHFKGYEGCMTMFDKDGNITQHPILNAGEKQLWLNTHDESVFYANDRQKTQWSHASGDCKPQAKGEGASIMVSDFLSPDYG